MAGRDALERVRDERSRTAAGVGSSFLLHLTHPASEFVPHEILGALEELLSRLSQRHAGDPLQLVQRALLRSLQIVLQLLEMRLAIGRSLLTPLQLVELCLDVRLDPDDTLLDLRYLESAILNLSLYLAAQTHGFLAYLDLRLASSCLDLALDVGEKLPPRILGGTHPRCARRPKPRCGDHATDHETCKHTDEREHVHLPSTRGIDCPQHMLRLLTSGTPPAGRPLRSAAPSRA